MHRAPATTLLVIIGISIMAVAPLCRAGPASDGQTAVDKPPACADSVVFKVCRDGAAASIGVSESSNEDLDRIRMRKAFAEEEEAQRSRTEYRNAHPDQIVVWGRNVPDSRDQGIKQFGAEVQKAVRPDCMTAYQNNGLLAGLFILHDVVTDHGCH